MEQKKKALGRGLEQLFSSEVLDFDQFESNIMESATVSDIKELPVEEIRPNPYQPRKAFNDEALQELAESINITPHYLSAIERGVNQVRLEKLVEIINELGCTADDLLVDVIHNGYEKKKTILSEMIAELPQSEQQRIIEVVETLVLTANKK